MKKWFLRLFTGDNDNSVNIKREIEVVTKIFKELAELDNFTDVLVKYSHSHERGYNRTWFNFDEKCKRSTKEIASMLPFKPDEVTIRTYINTIWVNNDDYDKFYFTKEVRCYKDLIDQINEKFKTLNDEGKIEFVDSFKTSLVKVLNFMKTLTIKEFNGDNYELVMEILNSIKEHQGKIDSTKAEELRKELQIEAEYLKRIKENPLYF